LKQPGIMTYGMNNGPRTFRPNFWTCVDDPARFLKSIWLDSQITKFVPKMFLEKKIFDNETWQMTDIKVGDCPNVIGFLRNEKFHAGRFLFEDRINWGNHKDFGGGRSVMLPALRILFLLGFRKVYLVGVDLDMSEENTYHFDEQRNQGAVKGNLSTYKKMNEEFFPALKPEFDEAGFEVFNCNPKSGLTVFPYVPFEDAINDATKLIGDTTKERVYGMYAKPQDKAKMKQEPSPEEKKNLAKMVIKNSSKEKEKEGVVYPQPEQSQIAPVIPEPPKQIKIIPNIPEMKPLPIQDQAPPAPTTPPAESPELEPEVELPPVQNVVSESVPKKTNGSIIANNPFASSTLGRK